MSVHVADKHKIHRILAKEAGLRLCATYPSSQSLPPPPPPRQSPAGGGGGGGGGVHIQAIWALGQLDQMKACIYIRSAKMCHPSRT